MFEIEKITLQKNLIYKGVVILKYKIEYPRIVSFSYPYGITQFNNYNRMKALNSKMYAEKDLFNMAKEQYDYNLASGFPIMVYELISDYTITYNTNSILSLYSDEYIFSGGAHGSTIRSSQNWNIKIGSQFKLDFIYSTDCSYLLFILKEIIKQINSEIENGSNQYFENFCELVIDNFKLDQFYLTDDEVIIYFQAYDIAPYSSGIQAFAIPR